MDGHETRATSPDVVDLFSGCGGMSLGFSNAGYQILGAYENWQPALDTHRANFEHPAHEADLSTKTFKGLTSSVFAVIGGPPCQDFSQSGKRKEGCRANLTTKFAEHVRAIAPEVFVMENVPLSLRSAAYRLSMDITKLSGYFSGNLVMDSSLYGIPQKRKRAFTIGTRSSGMTSRILSDLAGRASETPTTIRQALPDIDIDFFYSLPTNYKRRGIFSVDEPSPTIRSVNREMGSGYPGHPLDAGPREGIRALSVLERAAIQSFPPDFVFLGSKTDKNKMIGNAVPPRLAWHVADAIRNAFG